MTIFIETTSIEQRVQEEEYLTQSKIDVAAICLS